MEMSDEEVEQLLQRKRVELAKILPTTEKRGESRISPRRSETQRVSGNNMVRTRGRHFQNSICDEWS